MAVINPIHSLDGTKFRFISGLLVSACVNRAPEGTFGCALADVGVHDMLKV